jgi:hypothetical protein
MSVRFRRPSSKFKLSQASEYQLGASLAQQTTSTLVFTRLFVMRLPAGVTPTAGVICQIGAMLADDPALSSYTLHVCGVIDPIRFLALVTSAVVVAVPIRSAVPRVIRREVGADPRLLHPDDSMAPPDLWRRRNQTDVSQGLRPPQACQSARTRRSRLAIRH